MKKFTKSYPIFFVTVQFFVFSSCDNNSTGQIKNTDNNSISVKQKNKEIKVKDVPFDTADYNKRMLENANGDTTGKWPAKSPYPLPGAIFPYNRVVAFYGNLYSKRMGILGELSKD